MKDYDLLVVGTGLYGGVLAHEAMKAGLKVLAVESRDHIGGNIYTSDEGGIHVHRYGAHIFHTNSKKVWDYVNALTPFNSFINSPMAFYKGSMYSMPFNMLTFSRIWDISTPEQAKKILDEQRAEISGNPANLEEQAISLVGRDVYELLVKGYTEKQWGRPCSELPASIIKRLPVRLTYNNNYFDSKYQGIPEKGYTDLAEKLFEGAEIRYNTDYLKNKEELDALADHVIYTGALDAYFDECYGPLEYRSLRFEDEKLDQDNYQGNAVVNYTDAEVPWTRIIEHKFFNDAKTDFTIITREYPQTWKPGLERYYPVVDQKNLALAEKYKALAAREEKVHFGGRLGSYQYYDMDQVVAQALADASRLIPQWKAAKENS